MNSIDKLKRAFKDHGCHSIYVKVLAPNDNSKNQVYLGGSFEVLNILPIRDITNEEAGDWNRERFKASIDFSWLQDDGAANIAPAAQLILYPKYPEVRFSGFLARAINPPSGLMTQRTAGRLLFLGITDRGSVLGYVSGAESPITNEFNAIKDKPVSGVFHIWEISGIVDSKMRLIDEMRRIHQQGWIVSKRLDKSGNIVSCQAPNCGGYTLEAELGIIPNGYSEPDYHGWEVKQFSVSNFNRFTSSVITLMTPEPTSGFYKTAGVEAFLRKYGYDDRQGRPDRINFGGVHKVGQKHETTSLTMQLIGFDIESGKIRSTSGKIALLDECGEEAASWEFASLLKHWNRKHNKACYIPSISQKADGLKYYYGDKLILGEQTDFQLFLGLMAKGDIYYDPGIKMEHASSVRPNIKRRSQFRTKSQFLGDLYKMNSIVSLLND